MNIRAFTGHGNPIEFQSPSSSVMVHLHRGTKLDHDHVITCLLDPYCDSATVGLIVKNKTSRLYRHYVSSGDSSRKGIDVLMEIKLREMEMLAKDEDTTMSRTS